MVAVKTKRRLQTHPNILLACLALGDLMVGFVAQPLHITKIIKKMFTSDPKSRNTFPVFAQALGCISKEILVSGP